MKKNFLSSILVIFLIFLLPTEAFATGSYVASRKSDVFHKASCSYVDQIYSSNKVYYDSPQAAIKAGKRGCSRCHPENDISSSNDVSNKDDYNRGYRVGKDVGYESGYIAGIRDGYNNGKSEWYDKRYNEGYDAGYKEGYAAAEAELEPKYRKRRNQACALTAVAFFLGYPIFLDKIEQKKKN